MGRVGGWVRGRSAPRLSLLDLGRWAGTLGCVDGITRIARANGMDGVEDLRPWGFQGLVGAMVDIWSREKRSQVMARIRSKDTKPERTVRSALWREGFRFTVNGPWNRRLPGRPDIVLPRHRLVVFVHGCFWHARHGCKIYRLPKTRTEWWRAKLEGNRARDGRNEKALRELGWKVVILWECDMETGRVRQSVEGQTGMPEVG